MYLPALFLILLTAKIFGYIHVSYFGIFLLLTLPLTVSVVIVFILIFIAAG